MTVAKDLRKGHYNGIVDVPSPDTGCRLHPRCLACPRPTCVYDDNDLSHKTITREAAMERYAAIRMTVRTAGRKTAAQEFGVSAHTVSRAMKGQEG